jgi:predicted nicotinamide N-methyase
VRDVSLAARREVSPTQLPEDPDERRLLVMDRYDEVKPRLDELDKQFYRCKWQLEVAMARYALAHRDELLARK